MKPALIVLYPLAAAGLVACGGRIEMEAESTPADASSAEGAAGPGGNGMPAPVMEQAGPSCPGGSVTFNLRGASGWWVTQGFVGDLPGQQGWLSISCACGARIAFALNLGTTTRDCATCPQLWATSLDNTASPLPEAGVTQVWNGVQYLQDTCGGSLQCIRPACVEPGSYVATMCGCAPRDVDSDTCFNPVCVTIPFDYPGSASVEGFLPGAP